MSQQEYKPFQAENDQTEAKLLSPESKSFDTRNNTLLLRVSKDSVDLSDIRKTADQNGFDEKNELHITVLGFKNGGEIKKILSKLPAEEQQKKIAEIQVLIESTDWSFAPEKSKYHISKEYKTQDPKNKGVEISEMRESYIQKVHMQAMKGFYGKLNNILGSNLESPPPHITLFTSGSDREKAKVGIGINSEAELAQLNPELISETTPEKSAESERLWNVKTLEEVKDILPSRFHPEKKWMATHYKIEHPNGTSEEVEAEKTLLKIKSKDGTEIEVPAFAAEHITSLHLQGGEAGSNLESSSLESSFQVVAEHLPQEIPFEGEKAAFEIDVEQNTGTEGVSSQREMREKGIMTEEDAKILSEAKGEVYRLNIEGNDEEKKAFVDECNGKLTGNVNLGIRGGAITPFFTAEKQPTTKMFLVVGKEQDPDGSQHNRVWTMTPGRYMDNLPTANMFIGRVNLEGISEGASVADLWDKVKNGVKLSSAETALVDAQRKAQECWWEGGFIAPPEKKA